jgi:hypothetical protein
MRIQCNTWGVLAHRSQSLLNTSKLHILEVSVTLMLWSDSDIQYSMHSAPKLKPLPPSMVCGI